MATPIRAVYENGNLRLLDSVDLDEGQEIDVVIITTERERVLASPTPQASDAEIDEDALLREIDEAYRGKPPVSDAIIGERREGP